MPQITVRPFQVGDREAFFHVRAMTYNDGRPVPTEDQVFKTTRGYVGEVDGKIAGVFSVLDFTCTRGIGSMRDAAVAGVAVLPEYRRSGVGSAMMSEGLKLFRNEGVPMASLYAFRESYYRKFGYEVCGSRLKIVVPNGRYPSLDQSLPVRRLTLAEIAQVQPCYEAFARRRSGMNLRSEAHWSRMVGPDTAIYAAGDPVEGYAIVNHQWQFWQGQSISEVIWSTGRGYENIIATLCSVGINKSSIEWYEPSDSPFFQRFMDQGVQVNAERFVMYRAIDVPACLRALKPSTSGKFSIAISDEIIPENNGPWKVEFSPSGVRVDQTDEPDFELSVSEFVQAFLGEPSLDDLVRNDLVRVLNYEAMSAAQMLLPPNPTYCTDFF